VGDARVQDAIDHWAPRFIANGVDYNDFVRTTSSLERWEDWLEAWTQTAEVHLALGADAEAGGFARSAGEAFARAAVCLHFAKFVWMLDAQRNRQTTRRAIDALYAAHRLLGTGAQRIEAPLDGHAVVGNLRRPQGVARPPLVVLIPGLDSTKEEFFHWENTFLARGMATFSLDGPGQGETGFKLHIRHDYEVAVAAILDALAASDDVDLGRVGAVGVSLGGYYAARAGAFEPRLKAVAGISGPYDMSANWESLPELTRTTFAHHSGAADEAQARERAGELCLEGVLEGLTQPCLVVTGRLDRLIPWQDTKRIADEAPHATWVLYDDGTHMCNNIPFKYRPLVADWTREQLLA
jgi:pimeloyl-ACP methyl ester carboxylesterase